MNSKALLMATAALLALSAVSCGKDDTEESSVSISLSEEKTTEDSTEESSEETTSATETETTTTLSTNASGTATTDVSTDTTTVVTTETTSVPQPEETTQQEINEQSDNNNNDNNNNQDNNQQDNNSPQDNNNNDNNNGDNGNNSQPDEPQQKEVKFNIDHLLSDAKGLISDLGTPVFEGGGAACLKNGYDSKIYQYDGLEIQCYVDGDKEYIFQINITGGDYQTDKGIKIGSTRADVEAAYGTGTESGNMIIYSSGNNEMDIQYNGDTVVSIFFYTPV